MSGWHWFTEDQIILRFITLLLCLLWALYLGCCFGLKGVVLYNLSPGAVIMEANDRQVMTVLTVQLSFHHRPSTNRVSWNITIVGEQRGEVWLHVRQWWYRFMIPGLSRANNGMTVGLCKLSLLDSRRPPWYWSLGLGCLGIKWIFALYHYIESFYLSFLTG